MITTGMLYALGGLAYSGLECWLGKTEKVKAGSVLELAYSALKTAMFFYKK